MRGGIRSISFIIRILQFPLLTQHDSPYRKISSETDVLARDDFRKILKKGLIACIGVYFADMRFQTVNNTQIITAVLYTPYSIPPKRVAALQNGLPDRRGMNMELHVRSVLIKESTPYGYVNNTPDTGTPE